ncbi:MAG: LamG-like jellyroll fold domain-containing protein [Chitinophagaceae bacterium]
MSPLSFGMGSARAFGFKTPPVVATGVVEKVIGTNLPSVPTSTATVDTGFAKSIFYDPATPSNTAITGLPASFSNSGYYMNTRSGSWTIEYQFYHADLANASTKGPFMCLRGYETTQRMEFGSTASATQASPQVTFFNGGSAVAFNGNTFSSTNYFNQNAWNHFAIVFVEGQFKMFANGAAVGFNLSADNYGIAIPADFLDNTPITLGAQFPTSFPRFRGYISQVRISSIARYPLAQNTYTAPSGPFALDASTQLLIQPV